MDTPSHLGLPEKDGWNFEMDNAIAIDGKAGIEEKGKMFYSVVVLLSEFEKLV